jgi:ppGpp synthetase/RelA/SpoT-type nucleotidyltranferase
LEHHSDTFASSFAAWLDGDLSELAVTGNTAESTYPGGSKRRVSRAGDAVRKGVATPEDLAVIDTWRAAHRAVLNTFQSILRQRTRGTGIVIAQRYKRKYTIFDKLHRQPKMDLASMNDIAGCRLIFHNIDELHAFRNRLHKADFNHRLRNEPERYDYIAHPKDTGYRGIHDVYEYDVDSEYGKNYKGLFVEIQYRTFVQHSWATAVEVIGLITKNEPKFQRGDKRYERIMLLASEILARAHEGLSSYLSHMRDDDLVHEFLDLDEQLGVLNRMRRLNAKLSVVEPAERGDVLLMITDETQKEGSSDDDLNPVKLIECRDGTEALRELFKYEKEHPGDNVVLVRAGSSGEMRTAFQNYFGDTTEFVRFIEQGCEKLTGHEA